MMTDVQILEFTPENAAPYFMVLLSREWVFARDARTGFRCVSTIEEAVELRRQIQMGEVYLSYRQLPRGANPSRIDSRLMP